VRHDQSNGPKSDNLFNHPKQFLNNLLDQIHLQRKAAPGLFKHPCLNAPVTERRRSTCCLTKECYRTNCCRFDFLSSFLSWFAGREAPGPAGFQLFCNSHFGRRFGALTHAAQNHFSHTLGAPCVDPAMQRS